MQLTVAATWLTLTCIKLCTGQFTPEHFIDAFALPHIWCNVRDSLGDYRDSQGFSFRPSAGVGLEGVVEAQCDLRDNIR